MRQISLLFLIIIAIFYVLHHVRFIPFTIGVNQLCFGLNALTLSKVCSRLLDELFSCAVRSSFSFRSQNQSTAVHKYQCTHWLRNIILVDIFESLSEYSGADTGFRKGGGGSG